MAYEIQNSKGLVLEFLSTDSDGKTHMIAFAESGYRYTDITKEEAIEDVATLERLGYDVTLVEVQ